MNPAQWQEVKRIFNAACECSGAERASFVAAACGGDDALRAEVESLLGCREPASVFIEDAAFGVAANLFCAGEQENATGRRIGPYRVVAGARRSARARHRRAAFQRRAATGEFAPL